MKRKVDFDARERNGSPIAASVVRCVRPRLHGKEPSLLASYSHIATPAKVIHTKNISLGESDEAPKLATRGASGEPASATKALRVVVIHPSRTTESTLADDDEESDELHSQSSQELGTSIKQSLHTDAETESDDGSTDDESISSDETDSDETSSDVHDPEDVESNIEESEDDWDGSDSESSNESLLAALIRTEAHRRVMRTEMYSPLTAEEYAELEAQEAQDVSRNRNNDRDGDSPMFGGLGIGDAPHSVTTVTESADGTATLRMGRRPRMEHISSSSSSTLLLSRIRDFLPEMESANQALEEEKARGGLKKRVMELAEEDDDDSGEHVEMNLGLGILEERDGEVEVTEDSDATSDDDESGTDLIETLLARPRNPTFIQEV